MVDDMLIETSPTSFQNHDRITENIDPNKHNIVQIINFAWSRYESNIVEYPKWESDLISEILRKNR